MDFKFLKTPYHIFQIYICIYGFKIFLYMFDFDFFLALNCIVQIIAEETGASLLWGNYQPHLYDLHSGIFD